VRAQAAAGVVLALAGLVLLGPGLIGLPSELAPAASVVVLVIGLWATAALAEHLTALLMFAVVTLSGMAPPSVIFAGFAAGAFWLIFGGLVVALAVQRTGLGRRLALLAATRMRGGYAAVVGTVVALSIGLAFLVPAAMGRVVVLVPILHTLADAMGLGPGSPGRRGLLLAGILGTFVPGFAVLPANLPSLVLVGAAETVYGISPTYAAWLARHFPVLGLLKGVVLWLLVVWLFPDRPRWIEVDETPPRWTAAERRLLVVLLAALAAWSLDFVHGIGPGWVALTAGLVCLMPRIGFLEPGAFAGGLDFAPLFQVAGLLGVVSLIDASGLALWLGERVLAVLPLGQSVAWNLASVLVLTALGGMVTTVAGIPAVMTPVAAAIAEAGGLPLQAVLATQVIAFSCFLLPYQVPPVAVGIGIAGLRLGDAIRLTVPLALVTLLVLAPLELLWWRLIGFLP
jgi:di/tricarboxylate transporter